VGKKTFRLLTPKNREGKTGISPLSRRYKEKFRERVGGRERKELQLSDPWAEMRVTLFYYWKEQGNERERGMTWERGGNQS